jgi:hypothetical protein
MKMHLGLTSLMMSGCLVLDQDGKPASWSDSGEWEDLEQELEELEESQPERDPVDFILSPSTAPPDSTFIAALRSQSGELDWSLIESILSYGDIQICEMQPIYDELLLTIHVPADAREGSVDLVIEYADGDADFLENGLVIDVGADISAAEIAGACD